MLFVIRMDSPIAGPISTETAVQRNVFLQTMATATATVPSYAKLTTTEMHVRPSVGMSLMGNAIKTAPLYAKEDTTMRIARATALNHQMVTVTATLMDFSTVNRGITALTVLLLVVAVFMVDAT